MPTHRRSNSGVTLVETISAMVILSIAVPSMLFGLREATRNRATPILINRARFLAQERLEDILADRHSTTRGYNFVLSANYPADTPMTGMSRTTTITETGGPPSFGSGTGFKTATVQVAFTDGRGTSRTLSLSTIVTDYTP